MSVPIKGEETAAGLQAITLQLRPDQLADLDAWIASRTHPLTRSEAILHLALTKARIDLDSGD